MSQGLIKLALAYFVFISTIISYNTVFAQNNSGNVEICGFTLNTTSYLTPMNSLPTIWAPVEEPVFIRVFTTNSYLRWRVGLISERFMESADSNLVASSIKIDFNTSKILLYDTSLLNPSSREKIKEKCSDQNIYYQDIIIDDARADRSRVYLLSTESSDEPILKTSINQTGLYYFNVRRFKPTYAEASIGPVVSSAKLISHELQRLSIDGENFISLTEQRSDGQMSVVAGALLRPWGYNPLRRIGDSDWFTKTAFYVATPLSGEILKEFYFGIGYGTRGITLVGGTHMFRITKPLSTVVLDEVIQAAPWQQSVSDLTNSRIKLSPFVGIQLNSSLFSTFFGKGLELNE